MDVEALLASAERLDESVATVYLVHPADGPPAVLKLHRPAVGERFLLAVQAVQRHLVAAGFPAPEPLAGPARLGERLATVETLLDRGAVPDGHDPPGRGAIAAALARQVELCRPLGALADLRENPWRVAPGELWPAPHAALEEDAVGEVAARARAVVEAGGGGAPVAGHTDWRAQNLRFAGGNLVAAYDWESLDLLDEAALAGGAAATFTADWGPGRASFPSPGESLAFVADYERARGRPFTPRERRVARASTVYVAAFVTSGGAADLRSHFALGFEEEV